MRLSLFAVDNCMYVKQYYMLSMTTHNRIYCSMVHDTFVEGLCTILHFHHHDLIDLILDYHENLLGLVTQGWQRMAKDDHPVN